MQPKSTQRLLRTRAIVAVPMCALVASVALAPPSSAAVRTFRPTADAAMAKRTERQYGTRRWLRVGGRWQWRSYLRFRVRGVRGRVTRATLVLRPTGGHRARLSVYTTVTPGRRAERRITWRHGPHRHRHVGGWRPRKAGRASGRITVDVTRAVDGNGRRGLLLVSASRRPMSLASREQRRFAPRLVISTAGAGTAPRPSPPAGGGAGTPPAAAPARAVPGIWVSRRDLASRPTSGPAWTALKEAADGALGPAAIADQASEHDVNTLAAALVYARTGVVSYRAKAAGAIAAALGTERGGRTLALGRNLASYVIAADLIGLRAYDAALDARFRAWLSAVRHESLDGQTLVEVHERRANNWGTMAGASRVAADAYLGDSADLARAARVFAGFLGDRASFSGFAFGSDMSWQADPGRPVGVDPPGASAQGLSIDGALPDEMRRGCALRAPPCPTDYAWEGMQGIVVQAQILSRRGYDAWNWSDRAVLRAALFLQRLDGQFGGWWATNDDRWQPWLLNYAYGTRLPAQTPAGAGKIAGWTDWTFGG